MLWGETQFRQVLTVDREGFIFIPEIGQVFVNGLNLNLLESKLFRVFSQSYASLNPENRTPTTWLDVSLGNLRPLRIQVLGEVAQPGAYTVSPSTSLFSALYYFNGPTNLGSLRDIQLIRSGKKIASIDFYDFLMTGKKPNDQKLQLDDVIFIPRRLKTITIGGEVNRGGIYELKPEETFKDLIAMAGGLKITAYLDRSQIDRIVPFEDREKVGMDRMYNDVNLKKIMDSKDGYPLQDGDIIQIYSIMDARQNMVEITGAITRPGNYDLGESLKLSELIKKADGLLGDAYLERADLIRIKPDFNEQLIKLNLKKVLDGNSNHDIALQGMDKVTIYGITEMVPAKYVSIDGHVKTPGRYSLKENMTLYDLIFKSGGFMDNEFKKQTYLRRADLIRQAEENNKKEIISFNLESVLEKEGKADVLLRANDAIRIYSVNEIEGETRYVYVSGHVKRPGRYELFENNMRIQDLLFKAGGYEDPIFRSKTYLSHADLIRYNSDRISQHIISFNLNNVLSNKDDKQNIILLPGDEIRTYSETIFKTVESVTIEGSVNNPGSFTLKENMTLRDLILESGGLQANVYRYRIEIARINKLNKNLNQYAEIIAFNMDAQFELTEEVDSKKALLKSANSFKLFPFDLVSVRPDPYFSDQRKLNVSGEVLYPGDYTILSPNEKITDIINRAGGLLYTAYPEASIYIRNGVKINMSLAKIIKKPNSNLNFNVQDGDKIQIVSRPNSIEIIGQTNRVGNFKFIPNKRLNYYIKTAGGLNPDSDKNNIWVEYPNGGSKKLNNWSIYGPRILDGSTIIVGRKKEEEPFDRTEYAKELTSIIANLAQALAVLLVAAR